MPGTAGPPQTKHIGLSGTPATAFLMTPSACGVASPHLPLEQPQSLARPSALLWTRLWSALHGWPVQLQRHLSRQSQRLPSRPRYPLPPRQSQFLRSETACQPLQAGTSMTLAPYAPLAWPVSIACTGISYGCRRGVFKQQRASPTSQRALPFTEHAGPHTHLAQQWSAQQLLPPARAMPVQRSSRRDIRLHQHYS